MCTGIRIGAKNDAVIYARTMEFGIDMQSNIIMIPRNYSFAGITPSGKADGLRWQSTYAVVGANAFNEIEILDGVNEKGLAGGLFYFPEYAEYQEVSPNQLSQSIAPWQLMTWILSTCATVDEVKKAIPKLFISKSVFKAWGIIPPVHAIVHDGQQSIVIEYIKGKLQIYDNPLGVVTNAPAFDWHLTNLSDYKNISPWNVENAKIGSFALTSLGQGSGMLGLPGDFTSPSRFVRAAFFSQSAKISENEEGARKTAFRLLDLFNIPVGSVCQKEGACELTQWTAASDLKNKRYYFHTFDNRTIRMVDLMKMKLDGKEPVIMAMSGEENIVDITAG